MSPETGKFGSVDEVLDFAIAREIEANLLYVRLADMVKKPELAKILRDLAAEEAEHKVRLEAIKAGEARIEEEKVGNLNIADYVPDVEPHPNMDYAELLIVAMKKEDLSYRLYVNLAAISLEEELRGIFLKLAQEEAGHRLRFEIDYDLTTF